MELASKSNKTRLLKSGRVKGTSTFFNGLVHSFKVALSAEERKYFYMVDYSENKRHFLTLLKPLVIK